MEYCRVCQTMAKEISLSVALLVTRSRRGGGKVGNKLDVFGDEDIDWAKFYNPQSVAELWLGKRIYKPEMAGVGIVDWLVKWHNFMQPDKRRVNLGEALGKIAVEMPGLRRDELSRDRWEFDWTEGQVLLHIDSGEAWNIKKRMRRRWI